MVKILLIQLDRFGDNLFIVPLIKGLKKKYPGCHLTVLVREELKDILSGYYEVDCVEAAAFLNIAVNLQGMDVSDMIIRGYSELKRITEDLRKRGFDRVYNLNFNKLTTLLTSLLHVTGTIGFTVGHNGDRSIAGHWVNYMGCLVKNRRYNPFHIVDVYRNFEPGLASEDLSGFNVDHSAIDYADSLLRDAGVTDNTTLIALQPGASNRNRVWPAAKFKRLAELLTETGAKIVVLGTAQEAEIATEIASGNSGVIDLTGKTTFHQLAAVLNRCRLLISNDTGTVHLASAVGTRVIGLYMSHAYPVETGPYGEGHIAVSPVIDCFPCNWKEACLNNYMCQGCITPDDVYSVVKWVVSPCKTMPELTGNVSVDISGFDNEGLMTYVPLLRREITRRDVLRFAYKRMWSEEINTVSVSYNHTSDIKLLLESYDINNMSYIKKEIGNIISLFTQLELLADKGIQKADEIVRYIFTNENRDTALIQSWIEELNVIDSMIAESGHGTGYTGLLTMFYKMQKDNLDVDNPILYLRSAKELYGLLKSCSAGLIRNHLELVSEESYA
ncbi:MAG: glycosyltransferase family 9 protein [Nitrospirae bacterium]|nr:glycosyltransferase family 9 protein [Nitrospirota bacterium]